MTKTGQTSAQGNAAASCSAGPGNFEGWAYAKIAPPPGYQLTGPPEDQKYGNNVSLACGASKAAAGFEEPTVVFQPTQITFTKVS